MRIAATALLSLLFAVNALAKSSLIIDKVNRKDVTTASKEMPFSALIEGTVSDPTLAVFVMVHDPKIQAWRAFQAIIDDTRADLAGGYRWRAICQFGEFHGEGVGNSYQVRAIAIDWRLIGIGNLPDPLPANALQSNAITIKRVKK
jgi:hypothetical protein